MPFQSVVKNVCADCNNGWMSRLEETAQRVLAPLVLGDPGRIEEQDQGAIGAWIQKTALMAMFLSSAEERSGGRGLPPSEYAELFEVLDRKEPSSNTVFWVASFAGSMRQGAAWVTPIAVNVEGLPEPEYAHGYAMTVAVGALIFQGVRLTDLPFPISIAAKEPLLNIWPAAATVQLPTSTAVTDADFLAFAQGRRFQLAEPELTIQPLRSVVDRPTSELVGTTLKMSAPCRQDHFISFPAAFAQEGIRGRFLWITRECDCGNAYLIHVERDGAHVRGAGSPDEISKLYKELPGEDLIYADDTGEYVCKRDELSEPSRP